MRPLIIALLILSFGGFSYCSNNIPGNEQLKNGYTKEPENGISIRPINDLKMYQ
jgi:hypothetical protein